jgi:signal transduction histidine kinase/ABC-type multidrug transport system ATPase subunit
MTVLAANPASAPLLAVADLSVGFGQGPALNDIDLVVYPGELVAVTGEPGAGKSALIRCIAGDIAPTGGGIKIDGFPIRIDSGVAAGHGISVVWQEPELCDNLDVAGQLLLGRETPSLLLSDSRFHATAAALLARLRIPIRDTTRTVRSLSGGERQLLAIAAAIGQEPRLIMLDEPTASLGALEAAHVETLMTELRDRGVAVLFASRDTDQMLRIADRIVVLRHGSVVAELDPNQTHPDDVAALVSGHQVDASARRQLTRLHGLADSLVSADPSSSLSLILSALGAALSVEHACIHVRRRARLECAASLGFTPEQLERHSLASIDVGEGPIGRAAAGEEPPLEADLTAADTWAPLRELGRIERLSCTWSISVPGLTGVGAVITVFRIEEGAPGRDELDLLTLYAGYAASAVERDMLLEQVTSRNRVLETIREMLVTLAGPVAVADGLAIALHSLRRGLRAEEVGLLGRLADGTISWRAYDGPAGTDAGSARLLQIDSALALAALGGDGSAHNLESSPNRRMLAVPFLAPTGPMALFGAWDGPAATDEETALIEDAAHSLRLALEREEARLAHEEAITLRRSRELQRGFLSRLSHELRTPLTAIRGYATSLRQPDVTWDGESEQRFLDRIAEESGRLGRLVDDLLDFSAIESGVMRLQRDWCDLRLVVEAAVSCLPADWAKSVEIVCDSALPAIWADHDRLEQVFVNLLTNAFRHNPPGTRVEVHAEERIGEVEIAVHDNGAGFPSQLAPAPFEAARRDRSRSAGAGLGLSIARGIIDAHSGRIELVEGSVGTTFRIHLPIEAPDAAPSAVGVETGVNV